MTRILFIIPGDINLPTGGYRYDKAILEAWEEKGISHELLSLNGDYPFPTEAQKDAALTQVFHISNFDVAVIDGLAGGVLPEFISALSKKIPVVSLLHHPLCLENGLDEKSAKALELSELAGLQHVSHIITTSHETKRIVSSLFGISPEMITPVLPGVTRDRLSVGSGSPKCNLLCVGSVIERKGHRTLVNAMSHLKHFDWRLDCVGSMRFDEVLADEVKTLVSDHGLDDCIHFHGAVTQQAIRDFYHHADLFVLPSLYEGYGMVYAEAIVRGLPVIGTKAGAIPDTVPETCGILVEPDDETGLADAIGKLLQYEELLAEYKRGAIDAEPHFPTWAESANNFYEILELLT